MSDHNPVQHESIAFELEDNSLAAALFGPFNRNLVQIEAALDVRIDQRGNGVTVQGAQGEAAVAVLSHLVERLDQGQPVEAGDVAGALRLAVDAPVAASGARERTTEIRTRKKLIAPRTATQAAYLDALLDRELVFGIGPAGTGKTYLAVAAAVSLWLERRVERIVLSRPAVEAGERLGFLPGDMKDKVDPFLRPLYDALHDMLPGDRIAKNLEQGVFEVAPLAFMRGRTLSNAFVVLDEAQNCSAMQMKMFLTRLGENSRMAITGDPSQIDLPPGQVSGLGHAVGILEGVKGIGLVRFRSEDVVRHPLVARIVRAYDAAEKGKDA